MTPKLQARVMRAVKGLERLDGLRSLIDNHDEVGARSLVASMSMAGAEFLAKCAGCQDDTSRVYRAYEEIFAALENSEAVCEMLREHKVASAERFSHVKRATSLLRRFRELLHDNH